MHDRSFCLAILKALGVSEIQYSLSGGGDSGTTTLESVHYLDGRVAPLPAVTIGISRMGPILLDERLDQIVADLPAGDWCNNEGGYGTVILRPQETDDLLQIECDMTYGEDEADPDFEDDNEEVLAIDLDQTLSDTLTIDDTALNPAKGDKP